MRINNSGFRVWFLHDTNIMYCSSTGIFRVMFAGGKARVILKEILHKDYSDLLDTFVDGTQIVVMYAEVGKPDVWEDCVPYMTFTNCKTVRSWIPHLVPTRSRDSGVLTYFMEVESSSYRCERRYLELLEALNV